MSTINRDFIWNTGIASENEGAIYSPVSGGYYRLADHVNRARDLSNETRCKLAHYIAEKNLKFGTISDTNVIHISNEKIPIIDNNLIDKIEKEPFPNWFERIDHLLLFYGKIRNDRYDHIAINEDNHKIQILIALMYCHNIGYKENTFGDLFAIINFAHEMGFLSKPSRYKIYKITPKGYSRFLELQSRHVDSKQAFIAMWFDDITINLYEDGISPAVKQSKYTPFRIDEKEHNDFIDDQIIVEIKKSKFLVADLTSPLLKKHGAIARGGVYWEAGFAAGLDIPVIYTCREDILKHVHFDIKHRNFITWEEGKWKKFVEDLKNRILATI